MASFTTNGTLTATQTLNNVEGGALGPNGTIVTTASGVRFSGNNDIVIAGSIAVLGNGISTLGTPSALEVQIAQTGSIVAGDSGIFSNVSLGSEISNAGTISATVRGLSLDGSDGVVSHRVVNSGAIQSVSGQAIYMNSLGSSSTITNSGSILSALTTAIETVGTSTFDVTNSGTISGRNIAYSGSAGVDNFTNSGTVNGIVRLGGGNDTFNGLGGTVTGTVEGGSGNDAYIIDSKSARLTEFSNGGYDTVASFTSYRLSFNFEELTLRGSQDIKGFGNDLDNLISGNAGDNRLGGAAGNDTLNGLDGNDMLFGGSGADSLTGGNGNDTLNGGSGADALSGSDGDDVLLGRRGSDVLFGDDGADWLEGGNSNDTLQGGREDDTLIGGQGADKMNSGSGIDTFLWRAAGESPGSGGHDTIFSYEVGTDVLDLQAFDIEEINILSGFSGNGMASIRTSETGAGTTRVFADVDGNGTADLRFDIADVTGLTGADFLI